MSDIVKNKHVLGGLTLGDIGDKIKGLEVDIDSLLYPVARISGEVLELWETTDRCYDNEPADRTIDLATPIKVKDGAVILLDELTDIEETMVFGKTEFIQRRIDIL